MTLTIVRPPARFGAIKIANNKVKYFKEKSSLDEGWINGGFLLLNQKFLNTLKMIKLILNVLHLKRLLVSASETHPDFTMLASLCCVNTGN